jgi:hypothetical protein
MKKISKKELEYRDEVKKFEKFNVVSNRSGCLERPFQSGGFDC